MSKKWLARLLAPCMVHGIQDGVPNALGALKEGGGGF